MGSDSGLSWPSWPTRSLSSVVTFKWRDIQNSYIFSQQTTRDTKRRASKEASALSKDGQPVNINNSGDAEPGDVCDERWRKASVKRKMDGAVKNSPEDGMLIYRSVWMMFDSDFARTRLSISVIYNISTCIMSPSKDLGMLHLLSCHCKCMREAKQRTDHKLCSPCFPPMLMVLVREWVTVLRQFLKKTRTDRLVCTW